MHRPIPFICVLLLLLNTQRISAQCPAPVALSIDKIITTESRCQSSGTAAIQVAGGSAPFIYSITSGPVTAPVQSSGIFQSLAPGNYTVEVTDNCNTTVTGNFSIAGSYTTIQPTHSTVPPACVGGNDGKLIINVTGGRAPFIYFFISPSPVLRPAQASNTFENLPAGTYTYVVADSCGNYQTRTVTIANGMNRQFRVNAFLPRYLDCDSFYIPFSISPVIPRNFSIPYKIKLNLPNGTVYTRVIDSSYIPITGNQIADTLFFRYSHTRGSSGTYTMSVSNNCGSTISFPGYFYLDMNKQYSGIPGCGRQFIYTFDNADNRPLLPVMHCPTITYTLVSPAGAILTTQVNNSIFSGYPPGNGYKVIREDCCKKDTLLFDWEELAPFKISGYTAYPILSCKEGAAGVSFRMTPASPTPGYIILASGPPSITFGDGTVHNYTYPDTLLIPTLGTGSVEINYFTAGTYKIIAGDTCGQKDSLTFTITPSDLRHDVFTTQLIKGCVGANKIIIKAQTNTNPYTNNYASSININNGAPRYPATGNYADTLFNLSNGAFTIDYSYKPFIGPYYLSRMSGYSCDGFSNAIVVPPYTQPVLAASPAIAGCGATRTVALLPDSNAGVTPYSFRITAGPTIAPFQVSNVFPNLSSGNYTFLMQDACGNSYSNSYAIDTLKLTSLSTTGSTCEGGAATLSLPANPYYNYSWQFPNGSTAAGNSITINPVTRADTGRYLVTISSNINGCTDTKISMAHLNFCSSGTLPLTLKHFTGASQGNNNILQWQTDDEINTSYFIVERSSDGRQYTPIQQVPATGFSSNTYTASDYQPNSGKSYYRLKMVDKDGKANFSPVIIIANTGTNNIEVYPRLITGHTSICVIHPAATKTTWVQVAGMDGKIWHTQPVAKGATQTSIRTDNLPAGSYLVIFINNGARTATQVVKL